MKLTFAITFCFVLAIAGRSLADDDSRMGITTDGTDITTRVADSGDSLFAFRFREPWESTYRICCDPCRMALAFTTWLYLRAIRLGFLSVILSLLY